MLTDVQLPLARPAEISAYMARVQHTRTIVLDGITDGGSGLGSIALVAGLLGAAAALPASGVGSRGDRRQYFWSTCAAGIGVGVVLIGGAWIASLARASDANLVSGAGAMLACVGGAMLVAANVGVVREFRRTVVYADARSVNSEADIQVVRAPERDLERERGRLVFE